MRLDGFLALSTNELTGESTDTRDFGTDSNGQALSRRIEILSYYFRINRGKGLNNNNNRPIRATHSEVTIVKYVDTASTQLAQLMYKGKTIPELTLIVRGPFTANTPAQASDANLLKIVMTKVMPIRVHHVANPALHLLGPELQNGRPVLSEPALMAGPLEEVDLLCLTSMSWQYGTGNAVVWNAP